jgi:MFS family permease
VFLVTRWGGNALIYGIMGATYSVFQLVGAPILGRWSDIYGRRRILLLSQLGTLTSWVILAFAFALPVQALFSVDSALMGRFVVTAPLLLLFFARAFDGLTGGNVSVANAYLADVSSDEDRNANFGRMAVAANLGFILGPAIAGALGSTSWGELVPVLAALAISMIATLIILLKLPESRPCVLRHDPEHTNVRKVFGQEQKECFEMAGARTIGPREMLRLPGISRLLAIYFLVMLGFNFFYIGFPIWAVQGLRWSVRDTGLFFSTLSFALVCVQGPVLSRASRRWSDGALALWGSLILASSFPLFTSRSVEILYAGIPLLALGNGVMWPSVVSLLSKAAGNQHQGAVQGFASSLGAVASIIGLLVGGLLFETLEARVFLLSAVMIGVVFLLSIPLLRSRQAQSSAAVAD